METVAQDRVMKTPGLRTLVTGGSRGLGRAICQEFVGAGARVVATHRWCTTSERDFAASFEARGLQTPRLVESDAGDAVARRGLMRDIQDHEGGLDAIISNVAFAKVAEDVMDLKKAALDLSLSYSAWPLVSLLQEAIRTFGRPPRYLIAISSDGGQVCHPGYDLVGACKSVLETLTRYLAVRMRASGVRVNAVRPGLLKTDSFDSTFGAGLARGVERADPELFLEPGSVARVCVCLCSGWMDAVNGQVIVADEGWSLVSPLALLGEAAHEAERTETGTDAARSAPCGQVEVRRVASGGV